MIGIRYQEEFGAAVRSALRSLNPYSPSLDRDLSEIELGEGETVVVGGEIEPAGEVKVVYIGATAIPVLSLAERLGPGSVAAIGLTDYTREQRDLLRRTQRLLPLHEVDFLTAVKTAVLEFSGSPLAVSLCLDAFSGPRAVEPRELFSALPAFPGQRITHFHVFSGSTRIAPAGRTSALAAEIVRDAVLAWWG